MAIYTPYTQPPKKPSKNPKSDNPTTTPEFVSYNEFKFLSRLVITILVVVGLSFIALLWTTSQIVIDSIDNKTETYKTLVEQNSALNDRINEQQVQIELMRADKTTTINFTSNP